MIDSRGGGVQVPRYVVGIEFAPGSALKVSCWLAVCSIVPRHWRVGAVLARVRAGVRVGGY